MRVMAIRPLNLSSKFPTRKSSMKKYKQKEKKRRVSCAQPWISWKCFLNIFLSRYSQWFYQTQKSSLSFFHQNWLPIRSIFLLLAFLIVNRIMYDYYTLQSFLFFISITTNPAKKNYLNHNLTEFLQNSDGKFTFFSFEWLFLFDYFIP